MCLVKAVARADLYSCHTPFPALSHWHLATQTKSLAFLPERHHLKRGGNEWKELCGSNWLQCSYSTIILYCPLKGEGKALHSPQHNKGSARPPLRSAKDQILLHPPLSAWISFTGFSSVTSILTSIAKIRNLVPWGNRNDTSRDIQNLISVVTSAQITRELLPKLIHPFSTALQSWYTTSLCLQLYRGQTFSWNHPHCYAITLPCCLLITQLLPLAQVSPRWCTSRTKEGSVTTDDQQHCMQGGTRPQQVTYKPGITLKWMYWVLE